MLKNQMVHTWVLSVVLGMGLVSSATQAQQAQEAPPIDQSTDTAEAASSALIQPDPLRYLAEPVADLRQQTEQHGLTFELGLTTIFQGASDTVMESSTLWSFSYDFLGYWQLFEAGEQFGPGGFGWLLEGGRPITANRLEDLSANVGSGLGIHDDLNADPVALTELWWEQQFLDGKVVLTFGKIDQTVYFDANRIANDETTQFFATPLVNNSSVAFPDNGLGANLTVTPEDWFYIAVGGGDSNAVATHHGFDSIDEGEFFVAGEIGFMPEFENLGPGNYRFTLWHTEVGDTEGMGFALSFDQEIAPGIVPFLRYGYADNDVSDFEHFVSGGVGFEGLFGRSDDLLAIGAAWAEPTAASVPDETLLEAFYRLQLTDSVAVTPDAQLIFNPAGNPDSDVIFVGGVRVQVTF